MRKPGSPAATEPAGPSVPAHDRNRFRPLFDTSLDAVVSMDLAGRVLEWNRQAEIVFGWRREEALGRVLGDLIVPEQYREAHREGLEHYARTGEGPVLDQRFEITALRRDGASFPVELSITAMRDDTVFFIAFVRDITERKQYEASLKHRALEAELLFQVATTAAETNAFDDALGGCVESVCRMTGWPIGHALVPTPDGRALASSGMWHLPDDLQAGPLRQATTDMLFEPGRGLPGHIWQTGQPHWIERLEEGPDTMDDPLYARGPLLTELGMKSAFGFPIKLAGEAIAVLEFFTHERRERDPHLLFLVRSIGEHAGRALERIRASERQEVLMRELDHRVKNMLATVQSIAARTFSPDQELASFRGRLHSLARTHSLLAEASWSGVGLHSIVAAELAPYLGEGGEACARLEGEDALLPPQTAQVLTMVVHELARNAAEHGALAHANGALTITSSLEGVVPSERRLRIVWVESGAASGPSGAERRGFGRQVIERGIAHELEGWARLEIADGNARCTIEIPFFRL